MNGLINTLRFKSSQKLPLVLQDEITECGHACIVMISQYFGHNLDLVGLRKINKPSAQGTTMSQINQLLSQLKFKTRALKVPLNELKFIKTPAILHWNMNHFVVLKKVGKNKVTIHDPAIGIVKCSIDKFSESFTGIVLEVEKSIDFKKVCSKNKITLYKIIKTIPGINRLFSYLILISFSIEILAIINPLFMQYTTDQVLGTNSTSNLYTIAFAFIILIFINTIAEYTRESLILYTTTNFSESFGSNLFKHLLSLSTDFFANRQQGDVQSKFQSIDQIKEKISNDFINTFLDGVMFILTLTVMMIYSPMLTSIILSTLTVFIGLRCASYHSYKTQSSSSIYLHAKLASNFLETLRAINPIKLFLKEKMRFNQWRNLYIEALNSDIKVAKQQITYKISNHFLFNIEHIIVICVGANLVLAKKFSIGMLMAFLAYRLMLVHKASSLIQNIFDYKLLSIQLNRLSDIAFQKPELTIDNQKICSDVISTISLENISFQYNESERQILDNISLQVNPGDKLAIIGSSGCGKSTLLKIMMGILTPNSGKILVNNLPLKTYGVTNYRNKIAAVMQQDSLLSGSILENITFFDEEINLDLVSEVTKTAEIYDFISQLPMGYETLIGDMGSILSGGQKQRLLLARALYRKPNILFLDEATSHLDNKNEKLISNALKSLHITQIIVAHRKETIQMADRVINLTP
ncbi:MAG: peptidase domain-containing ABC transporter [Legionellaceae bacterium]|nr:peptidase domain-containing ABC transporter [Legionellaceae bacterium]